MWGMITGQLRRQFVRTSTLLVGVLVATAGFTLLTGSVETSRLTVKASADANFRAAYDILVRPAGARTGREESVGQVRPNFLSGQFGGITPGQWREIADLRGVEIAAPVAMLGYVQAGTHARVDVTGRLDPAADRQLLRLRNTWTTDRSLSKAQDPGSVYVYVTSNPVVLPDATSTAKDPSWRSLYTYRGRHLTEVGDVLSQGDSPCDEGEMPPLEVLPGGKFEPLCSLRTVSSYGGGAVNDQLDPAQRSELVVVQRHADGTFTSGTDVHNRTTSRRAVVDIDWSMTLLLAAVDPEQEARLVGVDRAMTSGRYLKDGEKPAMDTARGAGFEDIPLISTDQPYLDEQLSTSVSSVTGTLPKLCGRGGKELRGLLAGLPVSPGATTRADADTVFRRSVADGTIDVNPFVVLQAGAPRYAAGGGVLRPVPVASDSGELWRQSTYGGDLPAWFVQDTAFRPVTRLPGTDASQDHFPQFRVVGTYAVERLKGFSKLSEVPLETYRPPVARAADEASRVALGGQALAPNSNPGGYLATPPQLLTTLQSVEAVTGPDSPHAKDPISAVRVRVAGVHGTDEASRERIRAVAEAITTRTGLDVDITAGSSPAPQDVALGKGKFGRPALALTENWTAKGTAVALVEAADRKSVLLFGLVLGVCALFLGNAVAASVRTRQRELAVLACTGWTGARLAGLVLGEVALVAAVAGAAGAGASFPLGWAFGLDVTAGRALLAIPLVVATALLAGALPAIRAGRPYPAQALRGSVAGPRRARRAGRGRTLPGLAVSGALRTPSRSALGALALAVGVAAVSLVTAVVWTFQGEVQGTLLGEAVSLEVRGVDVAAAVLTAALGVFALADVLYLDSCERDGEFAMLRACGWADTEVMRLVVAQGAVIAVAGAGVGAATGLGLTVAFTGSIPAGLPVAVGAVAVAGVLAAVAGSVVAAGLAVRPVRRPGRWPKRGEPRRMDRDTERGENPMGDGASVLVEDLHKSFGTGDGLIKAVDGISLDIPAGHSVALVGASGSGKSTLLHLIGAIERADAGRVSVDGQDVTALGRRAAAAYRRTVGFVFQRFHLLPGLSALDNVLAPVLPRKVGFDRDARARELLAAVGLQGRESALPSQLSGGQQQRVAVARALIARPRLLLADEPTGSLDSATGEQIMDLVGELAAEHGCTLVVATHDMGVAERCTDVLRVRDGRLGEVAGSGA